MKKRYIKLLMGFLISIFCICLLLFIVFPQPLNNIFSYYTRDQNFKKITRGDQIIYLLGTIHNGHWTSDSFSPLHLKAVIENIKPDILLVESRQEQLDMGNLGDGPAEMLYSNLTATQLGIPVKGIDWWTMENNKPNSTNDTRDNNMSANIIRSSKGYKKVLVLMGSAHIPIQLPKFEKQGYKELKFTNKEKDKFFAIQDSRLVYPEGMDYYLKKRMAYERDHMDSYKTKEFKDAAANLIKAFNDLSKKVEAAGEK